MKLTINYDFIETVALANKGFSLKKNIKKVLTAYPIYLGISTLYPDEIFTNGMRMLGTYSFVLLTDNILLNSMRKEDALKKLRQLSLELQALNINTNEELLLGSKVYNTKYKVELNDKNIPHILQEKYIMVPSYDNGNICETSVLQEHIIGNNDYILSLKTPAKKLKLAPNGI